MADWWKSFFDEDYLKIWSGLHPPEQTEAEAEALWSLLGLAEGARVLDAPCGYGRHAIALAARGARVVGVDAARLLLEQAERDRGDLSEERLTFLERDLRAPIPEDGFDAAYNVFSSIGYGSDGEDRQILENLAAALRPGGRFLLDTMHRDAVVARLSRGALPGRRFPDGTLLLEEPSFDPIAGRIDTTWYWRGPPGEGKKSATLRIYCATELARLLEESGLRVIQAVRGVSTKPFVAEGPDMGGRLGLLCERPP